jgi:hypothetical protein
LVSADDMEHWAARLPTVTPRQSAA